VSEGTSDEDGPSGVYWRLLAPLCRLQRPVSATAPMHLHASPAFCFARPLHGNSSASSTFSHPWPTTSSSSLTVRAHPICQPKCLLYVLSLVPLPASSSSSSASRVHAPTLPVQAPFHLRMPLASSAAFEDARLPARPPAGVQGPRRARHTYLGRVIVTGIAPTSNAQLWQRLTVAQATQPCASSTFGRPAPGQHLLYLRP